MAKSTSGQRQRKNITNITNPNPKKPSTPGEWRWFRLTTAYDKVGRYKGKLSTIYANDMYLRHRWVSMELLFTKTQDQSKDMPSSSTDYSLRVLYFCKCGSSLRLVILKQIEEPKSRRTIRAKNEKLYSSFLYERNNLSRNIYLFS